MSATTRFRPAEVPRISQSARSSLDLRVLACLVACWGVVAFAGCAPQVRHEAVDNESTAQPRKTTRGDAPAQANRLSYALAEFNRGAALLDRYRYREATEAFEGVLGLFPDWTAARFNLGVGHFNLGHVHQRTIDHEEEARQAFEQVLESDPEHRHARFCLGLYHQRLRHNREAHGCFDAVHKADRTDPFAAYKCGETLVSLGRDNEAIEVLQRVIELDPGFTSAIYRLADVYQEAGERDKAKVLFERFRDLNAKPIAYGSFRTGPGYGSMGKYHLALGVEALPLPPREPSRDPRILFSPEIKRVDVRLEPWEWEEGTVELPGIAVGDLNGDGHLDLVLTAAGADGATSVWFNDGAGTFSRGPHLTDKGVSLCLGDVDNDGDLDLWLGRAGEDELFHNDGKGTFSRVPSLPDEGNAQLTACARLVDPDMNGGLDLTAFRWAAGRFPAGGKVSPTVSSIYANRRNGEFSDVAADLGLALADTPVGNVAYDDFDNDYDPDLLLFPVQGQPIAWVNDRGGKHHVLDAPAMGLAASGVASAASGDPYKSGNRDLLVFAREELRLYRNRGGLQFEPDQDFTLAFGRLGGTGGQFADMDNDGDLDVVIADALRDQGRGPVLLINDWPNRRFLNAAEVDPGCLLDVIHTKGDANCVVADFNADGRCDVLIAEMNEQPRLIENATQGGHFVELDLVGIRPKNRKAQSNTSAIGARVEVKSGRVFQQYVVGTSSGAPLRVHAGLGDNASLQWLRIRWPDAVLQAELQLAADQVLTITQTPRLTTTCPHVFAWDGSRFELVSDFGGVGGLGYWIAPDTYAQPDPTEYVPIPRLEPLGGQYVLQLLESLEETVYLDEAKLIAVDHPAGTEIKPHEMMAINVPPPLFEVFCFREPIEPVRAIDHRGVDVTERIRRTDRLYAGVTDVDDRFYGYAQDHFVELDFEDRLKDVAAGARLILVLYGSTQYPYSSINHAAYQAGLRLEAPSIHVLRDGQWVELFREVGCPAGLQHVMTVDVTGKLLPGDRRIRISGNMEVFWDRIFLGVHLVDASLRLQEIPAERADLHFRGYARAYSPDGGPPELYDYDRVERVVPWKLMEGDYTRYGEIGELLDEADDRYVIMGRGDEVTLSFPVEAFGPLASGHQRSFLVKIDGYTKDMDLYTACSDSVEPLPFHAMQSYPYGPDQRYSDNDETQDYRRRFNTRKVR